MALVGGPFGWMVDGRLDEVGGRLVLEALEDSRMAGPDHTGLGGGTKEPLENERIGYATRRTRRRSEAARAYAEHNQRVSRAARARLPPPG